MLSCYLCKIKMSSLVYSVSSPPKKKKTFEKKCVLLYETSSENCTFPFQLTEGWGVCKGSKKKSKMPKQNLTWLQTYWLNHQCPSVSREARDICGDGRSIIHKCERCVSQSSLLFPKGWEVKQHKFNLEEWTAALELGKRNEKSKWISHFFFLSIPY